MSVQDGQITTNITVIGFRRPNLLHTTLNALSNNKGIEGTPLYIFIDGARDNQEEKDMVKKTVELAEKYKWNGQKRVFPSQHNQGLKMGVRNAIDTSLKDYESTIIIEDDIVSSPFFFDYTKQGLKLFANDPRVAAICGHCHPYSHEHFNPTEPYFLKHFSCWGWATWRRSWNQICWDSGELKDKLKRIKKYREINFGIGEYVTGILEAEHGGYISTWAVLAGVSFFVNNQHCIYPPETLTNNIGWRRDEQTTHMSSHTNPNAPLAFTPIRVPPDIPVETNMDAWNAYKKMLYPPKKFIKEVRRKIKRVIAPALRPIKHKIFGKKNP